MNYAIKIKTTTHNQKRLFSLKYTKKPCHFNKKHICELIQIADEIEPNVVANEHADISGVECFFQRHEIYRYCLYISENPNDEMKLVKESYCLHYNDIETICDFLSKVFFFLLDVIIKDKIKELDPILSRVDELFVRETERLCER